MTLVALLAAGAGCRAPSPMRDPGTMSSQVPRERVARAGAILRPEGGVRWRVTSRAGVGAWAWPSGRVDVSRALVDRLDDEELAAALAHELGHLLDGGHLDDAPRALAGGTADLERRADRIGCDVLRRHGVGAAAMPRMLAKVAAATHDPGGELAARAEAARSACADAPPAR